MRLLDTIKNQPLLSVPYIGSLSGPIPTRRRQTMLSNLLSNSMKHERTAAHSTASTPTAPADSTTPYGRPSESRRTKVTDAGCSGAPISSLKRSRRGQKGQKGQKRGRNDFPKVPRLPKLDRVSPSFGGGARGARGRFFKNLFALRVADSCKVIQANSTPDIP